MITFRDSPTLLVRVTQLVMSKMVFARNIRLVGIRMAQLVMLQIILARDIGLIGAGGTDRGRLALHPHLSIVPHSSIRPFIPSSRRRHT